ncbi:hypothetical protein LZC95_41195 [Pendulispora brunnea]|uniref:Uncharacterized protein n=1 Tax=Pendulispora brunnea TaxID=2905690 RepID=A0ABZ2K294_9BACT
MQHGFKWTATLILIGVAGTVACSSGESGAAPEDRASDSLRSEEPSHESPTPGAQATAAEDPDPTCGQLGQPCCDWSCDADSGARCHPSTRTCEFACGFRGEACCRDASGVGHCYDDSSCSWSPPPTQCR